MLASNRMHVSARFANTATWTIPGMVPVVRFPHPRASAIRKPALKNDTPKEMSHRDVCRPIKYLTGVASELTDARRSAAVRLRSRQACRKKSERFRLQDEENSGRAEGGCGPMH